MRISFCVEMSYPIFGVVDSFLAFIYSLLVPRCKVFVFIERERERESRHMMSKQRRINVDATS